MLHTSGKFQQDFWLEVTLMELTCSCGGGEGQVRSKCGGGNSLSWRCKIVRAYWMRWHQLNYSCVKNIIKVKDSIQTQFINKCSFKISRISLILFSPPPLLSFCPFVPSPCCGAHFSSAMPFPTRSVGPCRFSEDAQAFSSLGAQTASQIGSRTCCLHLEEPAGFAALAALAANPLPKRFVWGGHLEYLALCSACGSVVSARGSPL